jgi:hypothetical protein
MEVRILMSNGKVCVIMIAGKYQNNKANVMKACGEFGLFHVVVNQT